MSDTNQTPDKHDEKAIAEKIISYVALAKEKGVNVLIVNDTDIVPPLRRCLIMQPDAPRLPRRNLPLVGHYDLIASLKRVYPEPPEFTSAQTGLACTITRENAVKRSLWLLYIDRIVGRQRHRTLGLLKSPSCPFFCIGDKHNP